MSDDQSECVCIVDVSGLHEIASTRSDNLRKFYIDQLKSGVICVSTSTWSEFKEIYEDEAAFLDSHITKRVKLKRAYSICTASIADKLNSGFSRGPYDRNADLYTASIATVEDYIVLSSASHKSAYDGMGCQVSELSDWAELFK
jgi:hypothetical protein